MLWPGPVCILLVPGVISERERGVKLNGSNLAEVVLPAAPVLLKGNGSVRGGDKCAKRWDPSRNVIVSLANKGIVAAKSMNPIRVI